MSAEALFHVTEEHPEIRGWQRALHQDRQAVEFQERPSAPVALVVNQAPPWWESYVAGGNTLVVTAATRLPWESAPRTQANGMRLGWRDDSIVAPGLRVCASDLGGAGQVLVHEDRIPKAAGVVDAGPVVSRHTIGDGLLLMVWVPIGQLVCAEGDRLRRFAPWSPVTERVAAVDKSQLVALMTEILADAVTATGRPYARPAYFPDDAPSVLVVRVDVDGVFDTNTNRIDTAFHASDLPVSFFVNGQYCRAHPGRLDLDGSFHQIGQHGDVHDVFATVEENERNLINGRRWVSEQLGIEPEGFVAPRGLWNAQLEAALIAQGYRYSSDFALDFDGLPFRTPAGLLQLPVHPYSPERATVWANEQGLPAPTSDDIVGHYEQFARRQLRRGGPIHVYGHPERLGEVAEPLATCLSRLRREHRLPALTLSQWADWWHAREQVTVHVAPERTIDDIVVELAGADGHALHVKAGRSCTVRHDGRQTHLTPADGWVTLAGS